jgi:heme exporter protein CcmD
MMENLAMGGYGAYVWSCFALTAVIVVMLEWRARMRHRKVYREIEVRVRALGDNQ